MGRWMTGTVFSLLAAGLLLGACGNEGSAGGGDGDSVSGDGDSGGDGDGDSAGDGDIGDGDSGDGDSGDGDAGGDGDATQIIQVTQIPGGGANSAPLAPGCGPETSQECTAPGGGCDNGELLDGGAVEVIDAGAVCFYGAGIETPSATVEHITESVNGEEYVHLRVIFDPNFVDTVYGECSAETGWGEKGHKFGDLVGSDHTELILYNCDGDMSMHVTVDFLSADADSACGFTNLGVTGGDGSVIVGDAEHVLAVGTSLDRNLNGCGYCDDEMDDSGGMGGPGSGVANSPCPSGDGYEPSTEAPEWDFRMVYELWIDADAFGSSGFCHPDIEYVHASPAKGTDDTILVEPDDCPPPPDDGPDCPPNYELYLTSEGEFLCAGPPNDGDCPDGYEIDLTSEGELCIPVGEQ